MASVQELILAAQSAQEANRPFKGLLDVMDTYQNSYNAARDRKIKEMQITQLDQEIKAQRQMQDEINMQAINMQAEAHTQNSFAGVSGVNSKPTVLPQQKLQWEIFQDEKGRLSRKMKVDDKTPKSLDEILAQKVNAGEMSLEEAMNMKKKGSHDPSLVGKIMPAAQVLALNEGQAVARMLPDVEQAIKNNMGKYGPVTGKIAQANPYAENAQSFDAQMRAASQSFGRFMEGGVLRKEDEEKYRRMFPQTADTDNVKINKLSIVRRLLAQKYESDRNAMGGSGYDITGFSALEIPKSIFDENGGVPGDGGWTPDKEARYQKWKKDHGY